MRWPTREWLICVHRPTNTIYGHVLKKSSFAPRPTTREGKPGGGVFCGVRLDPLLAAVHTPQSHHHVLRQPDLINDLPLLGVTDASRVEPIGELIGGACGVMPNKTCGEVLWHSCALTLGDEPLTGGVEYGPVQLWVTPAQVRIPLYDPVHAEVREQPS